MSETRPGQPNPEPIEQLSHRVFTSTVWNYVGHAATLLTWFLLTPFVVSELGARGYGLFVIAIAVMAYGQLFEFGLSSAVTRFTSDLHERREHRAASDVVLTALVLAVGLTVLTTLVGLALAPIAPDLFGVEPDLVETTERLMVVAGLTAGVSFTSAMLFAVLAGLQRFDLMNLLQIAATLMLAGFTIAALLAGLGVVWVVAAGIPTSLIIMVPTLVAIRRAAPELRLSDGRPRRSEVRRLLSFSWAVMFMQGATLIKNRTDEIVIAAALPVARVTPYALARRASESATGLTLQFTRVVMPLAAQLGARNEQERLRAVFLTGTRLTLAAYLGIGVALVALAGPFLAAWVGDEFRSAGIILVILAVAGVFALASLTADSVLQGIFKHRPLAAFSMFGALLNLGLSIALVGPWGIEGVAIATLVATIVETTFLTFPYAMRTLDVPLRTLVAEVLVPVALPMAPAAAVSLGLALTIDRAPLPLVLAGGAGVVLTYVGVYLAVGAKDVERELMRRVLRARTLRRPAP